MHFQSCTHNVAERRGETKSESESLPGADVIMFYMC